MVMVLLTFAALQTWNSYCSGENLGARYPEPSPSCINVPLYLRALEFFTRAQHLPIACSINICWINLLNFCKIEVWISKPHQPWNSILFSNLTITVGGQDFYPHYTNKKHEARASPGSSGVGNLPANAEDTGSIVGPGGSHISPGHNYWACMPKSLCSATRETTAVRSLYTTTKNSPHLLQLDKAQAQQQNPSSD